jgi:hypothetical protein
MKILDLAGHALCPCVVAALLAGCGGSPQPGSYNVSEATPVFSHDQVFHYTGSKQSFKVPSGVTRLKITAYGAEGAWGLLYPSGFPAAPGGGATVTATIAVTPGERLAIFVGGSGQHGGYNGGGGVTGESCSGHCASFGGGASDVRQGGDRLADRVVVAAGGGGGASDGYFCDTQSCDGGGGTTDGGAGGGGGGRVGRSGRAGANYESSGMLAGGGGAGGTQKTGGEGGSGGGGSSCAGSGGTLGAGGAGGPSQRAGCGGVGGGGGGGYYGGGGGGSGGNAGSDGFGAGGGGGGGSSFVEEGAKHVKMTPGTLRDAASKFDGSIVVLW